MSKSKKKQREKKMENRERVFNLTQKEVKNISGTRKVKKIKSRNQSNKGYKNSRR